MNQGFQPLPLLRHRSRPAGGGFTLVELLVALFITAVMFAMGYGAINQALRDREALKERQDRLIAVQNTVRILVQDFSQLAPRSIRDPVGDTRVAAFLPGTSESNLVTFTRTGWANPAGIQRPGLQRVMYTLEEGTLKRRHWPVLDATLASEPVSRDLLDRVRSVSFRYLGDASSDWEEQWSPPISNVTQGVETEARPRGIKIILELEDWGLIERVIEVAT